MRVQRRLHVRSGGSECTGYDLGAEPAVGAQARPADGLQKVADVVELVTDVLLAEGHGFVDVPGTQAEVPLLARKSLVLEEHGAVVVDGARLPDNFLAVRVLCEQELGVNHRAVNPRDVGGGFVQPVEVLDVLRRREEAYVHLKRVGCGRLKHLQSTVFIK